MKDKKYEEACFGAGCFWGVQSAFDEMKGVISTEVGFMGGNVKLDSGNPYREVCSGSTGHAEVVYIKYNSKILSYQELLSKFFELHDPTQVNRQGPDIGDQYRSAIFYYDARQKQEAMDFIKKSQKNFKNKIATQVVKAEEFFKAEEYHQKYLSKQGLGSCHI
ncbi:MAG: peptide-methionine (S)-S-oxide reductase MsrA [Nanoarchaeota archaeon]|nr:peptide-methionine (S)-S-oxide reductase MsrA [Nanoarchaeota archaeon]